MQEWVETLRSKLREMKILSPRENLYTKLPEIRAPLLPTRDPTSPLPAPPPVPAALVPGVERIISHYPNQHNQMVTNSSTVSTTSTLEEISNATITTTASSSSSSLLTFSSSLPTLAQPSLFTAMSNTLSQNLLNMLCDPLTVYNEQLNAANEADSAAGLSTVVLEESFENLSANNVELDEQENVKLLDNSTVDNNCFDGPTQLFFERDNKDKSSKKNRKEKKLNENILTVKNDTEEQLVNEDKDVVGYRCNSTRQSSDLNNATAINTEGVRVDDVLINPGLSAGKLVLLLFLLLYDLFLVIL